MIWGISCFQFCNISADHKEGITSCKVPMLIILIYNAKMKPKCLSYFPNII